MIIGIDGNEANISKRVGVHQYAYEILWGLYRGTSKKRSHEFRIYLKESPLPDLPQENSFWKYVVLSGGRPWILTKLTPYLVRKKSLDVFFSPSHYLPPLTRTPKVCTIHDLGYLKFSDQFRKYDFWQLKYWTAISIIISKYIISVSDSTKNDIVRHYPFASNKVEVIHHGYDGERFNNQISSQVVRRIKNKYGILGDYILFLSTLKPSKNIEGLLEAYGLLKKKNPQSLNARLVIAGKKGWLYQSIFEKVRKLNLEDHVIFTDYVMEDDKPGLIAGAKLFVLPSFWEGFGIDVLEALACGIPAVVSDVASLPEVAGKAGVYVNPNNPESIAEGIAKVLLAGKREYNKFVEKGLRQVQNFSWEKAAEATLAILEKAGGT